MSAILITLALILLVLGLLGTILPALPGLPLMFAGAWLLAYVGDYQVMGTTTLIALGLLTIIGVALDYIAGMLGAKFSGASKQALWGALIGAIVGVFFGLPGILFGPLAGAAAGEFIARRDLLAAGKVGIATFIGFIIGVVAKIGCALAILLTIIVMYIASLF
ncbi:DUF456 domain-containing protein [Snodgrassella sp. CFCC 13594]|uniref:DUF456 domain-containing protein n=1 Tax=Snodgrassella sp. CFCC 13594 TaxID=1775559 RepID=UPI00082BE994|nr:DUF456 domain-containing protein [Snodgrassella sp. CFCC 13594]